MSRRLACASGAGYWPAVFIEGNQRVLMKLTQCSGPFRKINAKASNEFLLQRLDFDAQQHRDRLKSEMNAA